MSPESDFEEIDSGELWAQVYSRIRSEASLNHDFSLKDSRKPEYRSRNRYRDVSPYDHSRIVLERNDIDYINANLVLSPETNRKYILTQGPLPGTAGHFWLMIFEQDTRAVLMLNRIIEKSMVKCHKYYPSGGENEDDLEMTFSDVDLKVTFVEEQDASYFTVRTLELTDLRSGQTKEIMQFHYTTWPDFGVPQSPAAFLNFLMAVRRSGALEPTVGPPVIHCSAGIGRSGTFCLVDTCLLMIENNRTTDGLDIQKVLLEMRSYRMGLIQTPDQLRFSYLAVIEGAKRVLSRSPDSGFESDIPPLSPEGKLTPSDEEQQQTVSMTSSVYNPEDLDAIPDEPPPLPPRKPRASQENELNNFMTSSNSARPNGTSDASSDLLSGSPDTDQSQGSELRRRKREERLQSTAQKIDTMKRKQREHEAWRERRTTSMRPLLIGAGLVFLGSMFLYKYYWSS